MDPNDVALLVTSPNTGGGLFLYLDGTWTRLSDKSATGLAIHDGEVYAGFQQGLVPGEHTLACLRQNKPHEVSSNLIYDIHDIAVLDSGIYVVGTWENAVLRFDTTSCELLDRWQLSEAVDSWHINSVAEWNGELVYSAFGEFAEHRGYANYARGEGFVRSLRSDTLHITGLHKPHTLVPTSDGGLLIGNSGEGELRYYDARATLMRTLQLGGFVRGITHTGDHLYAGVSAKRGGTVAEAQMASIRVIASDSWETVYSIPCPFSEIYDIRSVHKSQALQLVATMINARLVLCSVHADGLTAERDSLALRVGALSTHADGLTAERDSLALRVGALSTQADRLTAERDSLALRVGALSTHADGLAAERDSLALRVNALEASTSWRLTRPARIAARVWNAMRQG